MIYMMKGFALQGVGAPTQGPPPLVDFDLKRVVDYYQSAAPPSLPSPEPWPAPGGDPDRFARRAFRAEAAEGPPLVANVAFLDLDGKGRPLVVAADMGAGLVLGVDPARPRVASSARPRASPVPRRDGRPRRRRARGPPRRRPRGRAARRRREGQRGVAAAPARRGLPRRSRSPTGLPRVADVQAADFDEDGDLDLIVAAFGWRWIGGIYLLENRTTDWTRPCS